MAAGRNSRRSILIVAGIAVLTATGGFLAAQLIVSPADAAARTAAPPAAPITVPIERKALDSAIVTRGDIAFTGSVQVTISAGGTGAAAAVVTGRVPELGSVVENGTVLLEVTGRPVLALSGELPTYRSLAPGSSGPDVEQLEATLAGLGYDPGPQDKVYDAATGAAVAKLYSTVGYAAPQPSEEVRAALAGAQASVTTTAQAVTDAQKALSDAGRGPAQSERLRLQGDVDAAQASYDQAKVTPGPANPAAVDAATRNVTAGNDYQAYVGQNLQAAIDQNWANLADWQAAAIKAAQGVVDAQAALDAANHGGPPSSSAIAAARNQLDIAKATRDEALKPADTTVQQQALTAAQSAATDATTALTAAQAAAGTPLPAQEVVWLANMPRRIDEVLVSRGSVVDGAVLTVSGADLSITAHVSAEEAGLLTEGLTADLTVPGIGQIKAVISKIGGAAPAVDPPADGSPAPTGTQVVLQPKDVTNEQAQKMRGANVKVTIPVASTTGEVLVAPVAALFSDDQGTPRVEVMQPDGKTRFQPVTLGLSTGGEVEVKPIGSDGKDLQVGSDSLDKGSLVVVGR